MKSLRWSWPLLTIALAVLISWALYALSPAHPLRVIVLDKTVPFQTRTEHRSLFWLLNHLRIVHPDGRPYDLDVDYLGAFPGPRAGDAPALTVDLTVEKVRDADLLYLADTYGVYSEDLASGAAMKEALERSKRLYGGVTVAEAEVVRYAVEHGAVVVAEFNTLGSPTSGEARESLERTLGVHWTRWIGRSFARLDDRTEVPEWMRRDYEREWGKPWEWTGPGFVLLQDDEHCEVLRLGHEVDRLGLLLQRESPQDPVLRNASDGTSYPYWFDIVQAMPGTDVLANYEWQVTPAGAERLKARGLPLSFPAVLRRETLGMGPALYFAGDFADNPMRERPVPLVGYMTVRRWLEGGKYATNKNAFYWRFYAPMMESLLLGIPAAEGVGASASQR